MIIIEYDPNSGNAIPDGQVSMRAFQIARMASMGVDAHLTYGTANMLRKVLNLTKSGRINNHQIVVKFDATTLLVDKSGDIIDAPDALREWVRNVG